MNIDNRVLITGGAGFIGSHLAETLLVRGYSVTILDDLSTGSFENIEHLVDHTNFHYAIDSIMNEIVLDRLASECSIIFHLAAAVGVKLIVEKPVHTIETNVMGTEAVLKVAQRYRSKVIIVSTSEVYGKGYSVPFVEDDDVVLGPTCRNRWAYATSKMLDEFLALAYYSEKKLPVVICRLFNTVGPRQTGRYGMVVPRFVQQALQGKPLTVYGNGKQSRCFLHVLDAIEALIALATCSEAVGQVFNVGTVEEITIHDLASKVLAVVGERINIDKGENIVLIPYEEAYAANFEDMKQRIPDNSKVYKCTGWEPKYCLEDILRDVIADFKTKDFSLNTEEFL